MDFENLTEEQKAKARECKSAEELLELAQAEDIELSDEQLEAVAGGSTGWEDATGCDWYGMPGDPCDPYTNSSGGHFPVHN